MEVARPGFLDNLSMHHLEILSQIKAYITQKGLAEDPRWTDWNLLRFCRARNFDLPKIVDMINKFCAWFYPTFAGVGEIDLKYYSKLRDIYGHGYYNTDRIGRPVYIERTCELKVTEVFASYTDDELTRYYIQSYERLIHVMFVECSKAANRRIEQSVSILDLDNVNTFSLFVGKTKAFVNLAINIAQNYYPEIMGKTYILNSGYLFAGLWAMVKPWIDAKTIEKIKIHKGNGQKELHQDIDPKNLPKFLGGSCEIPLRADHGPWLQELEKSRANKTLFHSDPALVNYWYPSPFKTDPQAAKSGVVPAQGSQKQLMA